VRIWNGCWHRACSGQTALKEGNASERFFKLGLCSELSRAVVPPVEIRRIRIHKTPNAVGDLHGAKVTPVGCVQICVCQDAVILPRLAKHAKLEPAVGQESDGVDHVQWQRKETDGNISLLPVLDEPGNRWAFEMQGRQFCLSWVRENCVLDFPAA